MTEERKAWLAAKTIESFNLKPYTEELFNHLLRFGGEFVILWVGDESEEKTNKLLDKGSFDTGKVVMNKGEDSNCFNNCNKLYSSDPRKYELRAGYALSLDSIWRPHCWLVDVDENIIETTEERVLYLGTTTARMLTTEFLEDLCNIRDKYGIERFKIAVEKFEASHNGNLDDFINNIEVYVRMDV